LIEHENGAIVNTVEGGELVILTIPAERKPKPRSIKGSRADGTRQQSSSAKRKEEDMSVLSVIGRIAAEYSEARARYLTERQVQALPFEIQKDIGWPDVSQRRPSTRAPLGTWAGDR
jgi:hypothetical protein